MTIQEILDSGAIGIYRKSTFIQGMAAYPCFEIDFNGGTLMTSHWLKPTSEKAVKSFIAKHTKQGV
jgi:hypothetical protein